MLIYIGLLLLGPILTLIGLLGVIGSFIKETHTATVTVEIGAPRDQVWAVIDDVQSFPSWFPDVSRVEIVADDGNKRTFRQVQGRNSFVLAEVEKTPLEHVKRTITDDNGPFSGSWDHTLTDAAPGRTTLVLTENGTVKSPIPRAIMKLVIGEDFYLKRFAAQLQRKLGA